MSLKGIALATGVLLVLAGGGWFIKNGMGPSRPGGLVGKSLLDGVDLSQTAGLTITHGEDQVTLKAGSGGWRVAEQADFPAKPEKIRKFLLKMQEEHIAHKVTENPKRFPELGLLDKAENGGKWENQKTASTVALTDAGGKTLFAVLLGNDRKTDPAQNGGFGGQYIRYPGQKVAYLIPETFYLDSEPRLWLDNKIFDWEKEALKSFTISHAKEKKLVFSRADAKSDWKLAGSPTLKQPEAKSYAERLATLTINRLPKPGQDAKTLGREKLATLEMELFDGRRYGMTLGEKKVEPGNLRFMTLQAGLPADKDKKDLREQVDAFNHRFAGRFPAIYNWEAENLLKTRADFLPAKEKKK